MTRPLGRMTRFMRRWLMTTSRDITLRTSRDGCGSACHLERESQRFCLSLYVVDHTIDSKILERAIWLSPIKGAIKIE